MKIAITVGLNGSPGLPAQARRWADELKTEYLPRLRKGTLADMLEEYCLDALIVATNEGPRAFSREGTLFFHPGMAKLRIDRIDSGERDNFCQALALKKGSRVLDCTMGLAADAAVASYVCGSEGSVTAVEASLTVWFVVSLGLQNYGRANGTLRDALRRIKTIHAEAGDYLRQQKDDAFDVVYFDPMFQRPVSQSSNMTPLRPLAYDGRLTDELLSEALRVAPRVVVKERGNKELMRLGFEQSSGGRYSRIKFGIRSR
ncbi:MAG: class I SAM-dependent methyltransferase [Acholeplasmataceae bacterium]|nr:class I SAM-dependent methyltransferase [Acidaminococcaceae bacterium]NLY83030.1 class I SAM-dependent methyltransferase [Acholeplasmataceae bacterium]